MSRVKRHLVAALAAGTLFAFGCAAGLSSKAMSAEETEPLTSAEITELLAGNTIKGKGFVIYYEPDGTMRGLDGGHSDSGTWTAEDDNLCVKWRKWVKGKELCWKLRRDGSEIRREAVKNARDGVVAWHQGNSDNL